MDDHAGTEDSAARHRPQPRDGSINFDGYSLEQLRELKFSIDPESFPENHRRLLAALAAKEAAVLVPADLAGAVAGQFSRRTALLGWLQAKARLSPVYGHGLMEINGSDVILSGWARTWLGLAAERVVTFEIHQIVNVVKDDGWLQFAARRRLLPAACVRFRANDPARLDALASLLPAAQTAGFMRRWSAIRGFDRKLNLISGTPWVTPAIVALNVLVFVLMAISARSLGPFSLPQLWSWGANFGPATMAGQWWRLITATFVHGFLMHLVLNMWALWTVGRWTERLYGRANFIFIYFATAALSILSSIAWQPSDSSVGASGPIFGVFGAFLAAPLRLRGEIPASILRRWWPTTLVFVLFNLVNGALTPQIDNAAHVGGLLSGFLLGAILIRPLQPELRRGFAAGRYAAALGCIALFALLGLWQLLAIGSGATVPERFLQRHSDFAKEEAASLQTWNGLLSQSAAGLMSNAELAYHFEQEVLPFWQKNQDLVAKDAGLTVADVAYEHLVERYVRARLAWAQGTVTAARETSPDFKVLARLAQEANVVNAQIDRIGIRARMEHRPQALANSSPVAWLRQWWVGRHCFAGQAKFDASVAEGDASDDGPFMRHEVGCQAQRLLIQGRFARLDTLMNQYKDSLEDLPDGSSRYEAVISGLLDLFRYGRLSEDAYFGYMADWRRAVKGSVMAELVEAELFSEWAWTARGEGTFDTISRQNMAAYAYRTEMAAAALEEIKPRARDNPLWYVAMLEVGLDQGKAKDDLRQIFEDGYKIAPAYQPLYRRMLRALMPRWGGSLEDVDAFIGSVDSRSESARGHELYASLYSTYAALEGDTMDFFEESHAGWSQMREGYEGLLKRYPHSDFILNRYASFACRAADKGDYWQLRRRMGERVSSPAWSEKYSLSACDRDMAAEGGKLAAASPKLTKSAEPVQTLAGVRLGMSRDELLKQKGEPSERVDAIWRYKIGTNGAALLVTFAQSAAVGGQRVRAVEYQGDGASAPEELPFLNEFTPVHVITYLGGQTSGNLTTGDMTFTFKNGVFIRSHDEQVNSYGIFDLRLPGP